MDSKARKEIRVGGRFKLEKKIGSGSFGEIYKGTDITSTETVAVKLESLKARHPQLIYEARLYKLVYGPGSGGFPRVRWYGTEGDYNVMVLDLLGPSLEDLFNACNRRFSLKTTLMLADQMISRLEYLHSKNYLHRDIKPQNFLIGRSRHRHRVFLIDLGLAKKYRDPKTMQHAKFRSGLSLTGTARYASINTHMGYEQSRRDDLEALGYVLVYFAKGGQLPWQGLCPGAPRKVKYAAIRDKKCAVPVEELCRELPVEFTTYLNYSKSLKFEEQPDYSYLRRLFKDLFVRLGYKKDYKYDWSHLSRKSRSSRSSSSSSHHHRHAQPHVSSSNRLHISSHRMHSQDVNGFHQSPISSSRYTSQQQPTSTPLTAHSSRIPGYSSGAHISSSLPKISPFSRKTS